MEKQKVQSAGPLLKNWLVWISGSIALCSSLIFAIFWWTNIFRDAILSELQLKNGTATFALWQRPAVQALYKVHIFNYSNVEDFEKGLSKKLKVEELGPYIYKETVDRQDAFLHENGTVSYQENKSYEWVGGRPDDELLVIPNVPLFGAMAYSRDIPFMAQVTLTAFLTTLNAKPFVKRPASGFIWGYDDPLFNYAKPLLSLQKEIPFDQFGILAFKPGHSKDRITIHTGSENMDNLGVLQLFNGKESQEIWGDEKCDKVGGTDGTMFPPKLFLDPNATLHVFSKELCRPIPLEFKGHASAFGVPTLRYKPPTDFFTSSPTKDSCYCQKNKNSSNTEEIYCPVPGIFNASACHYGLPIIISFPHFLYADQSLFNDIDGLNPQEELHESIVDLHPRLGVPMAGRSRIQINLEARKADGVPFMGGVKDGMILPLIWFEVGVGHVPDPVINLLKHAYFTVNIVEACFQWGSLLSFISSVSAIFYILRKKQNEKHPVLHRNTSGENPLLE